jgi:UDP-N-acetylmuramate dehydrogenase
MNDSYAILGRGSNTLISDSGYSKSVIHTGRLNKIELLNSGIYADAGANLRAVAAVAREAGLSGFERLAHIPGSVGGAVYMNAGAYGADTAGIIEYADVYVSGKKERLYRKDLGFSYRSSAMQLNKGLILGAYFKRSESNYYDILKEEEKYLKQRRESQPMGEKSLGSVFKAVGGIPAAKYIERLEVKGLRRGGAEISKKHCNFIVNAGDAKTADYIALARHVQDMAYSLAGVRLIAEITYIGEPNEDIRRLSHPYDIQPR